jgi:predicted transcriptional regulator
MASNSKGKSEAFKKQVIALLLNGMAIDKIATELNVSDTTIQTWLKDDKFKTQLRLESENIYNAKMSGLLGLIDLCNSKLSDILNDSNDRNKLTAIKLVYERIDKYHDLAVLDRIQKLEEKLSGIDNTNGTNKPIDYESMSQDELMSMLTEKLSRN